MKAEPTIESIFEQIEQLKEDIDKDYQEFQARQQPKKSNKLTMFFRRVLHWFKSVLA